MGTPDFAVLPLKKIVEAGFDVVGVVTNPDKPAGRGQKIQASSVKKYALEQGIPLLQPEKFRDEVFCRIWRLGRQICNWLLLSKCCRKWFGRCLL